MERGSIKTLRPERGFGFIRGDLDGREFFFHRTDCALFDQLEEGDTVLFNPVANAPKGARACNVEPAA